ncbi:MAG TPA: sigma 54-interacting transcriptional regulator, partial [Planctomycetaceae bacterium]
MAKRKKKSTELDYWLAGATLPMFVIDAKRTLRAFNAGCQALTGWAAADVIGETCHYGSASETGGASALAASLCPPPEVFAGQELSASAYLFHQQGHAVPKLVNFFPLRDENGQTTAVLGVVAPLPAAIERDISPARQLHAELAALRMTSRGRFGRQTLVAQSAAMRRVMSQVELAQKSHAFVLLSGAAGTGKEHVARVIHLGSAAKSHSFVALDCRRTGADELVRVWNRIVESHSGFGAPSDGKSSAATPASATKPGPTPLPGTILLVDIEFVPRDLQERLVAFFAASDAATSGLRLLSSTTLGLADLGADERLRADFYALISPLAIEMPPLSRRSEDLPPLAQYFLEDLNRQEAKQAGGFDEQIWPLFSRYAWPGNLDELAAVVRSAHLQAAESLIRPHDLPFRFRDGLAAQELSPPAEPTPLLLDPLLTRLETRLITLALERSKNNKSKAADVLGINRARLLRRIEQLQIGSDVTDPA